MKFSELVTKNEQIGIREVLKYPRKKWKKWKKHKRYPNSVTLKENIFQKVNIIIFQEDFLKYDLDICKLCVT
jgi:hypothetical protein